MRVTLDKQLSIKYETRVNVGRNGHWVSGAPTLGPYCTSRDNSVDKVLKHSIHTGVYNPVASWLVLLLIRSTPVSVETSSRFGYVVSPVNDGPDNSR